MYPLVKKRIPLDIVIARLKGHIIFRQFSIIVKIIKVFMIIFSFLVWFCLVRFCLVLVPFGFGSGLGFYLVWGGPQARTKVVMSSVKDTAEITT